MEREFRQSTNALTLLAGVSDMSPYLAPHDGATPMLVQQLAAGTPSEMLANRPDILAAEHRLKARNADIGAARAAFFPRISLTGMFGSASSDLSDLFKGGQRAWSFAPQVTLPIFDAGRNLANLDLAKLRKDMAVAEYEQSIQTAFREVMDALAATDTLRRQEDAQRAQAASSQAALALSEARYRGGVDNYLRYLDAQRSDFANQIALIEVRTERQGRAGLAVPRPGRRLARRERRRGGAGRNSALRQGSRTWPDASRAKPARRAMWCSMPPKAASAWGAPTPRWSRSRRRPAGRAARRAITSVARPNC